MFSRVLLTASRRPDRVGVLSMSASNTSSAAVLTYSRTNGGQGKKSSIVKLLGSVGDLILRYKYVFVGIY